MLRYLWLGFSKLKKAVKPRGHGEIDPEAITASSVTTDNECTDELDVKLILPKHNTAFEFAEIIADSGATMTRSSNRVSRRRGKPRFLEGSLVDIAITRSKYNCYSSKILSITIYV